MIKAVLIAALCVAAVFADDAAPSPDSASKLSRVARQMPQPPMPGGGMPGGMGMPGGGGMPGGMSMPDPMTMMQRPQDAAGQMMRGRRRRDAEDPMQVAQQMPQPPQLPQPPSF